MVVSERSVRYRDSRLLNRTGTRLIFFDTFYFECLLTPEIPRWLWPWIRPPDVFLPPQSWHRNAVCSATSVIRSNVCHELIRRRKYLTCSIWKIVFSRDLVDLGTICKIVRVICKVVFSHKLSDPRTFWVYNLYKSLASYTASLESYLLKILRAILPNLPRLRQIPIPHWALNGPGQHQRDSHPRCDHITGTQCSYLRKDGQAELTCYRLKEVHMRDVARTPTHRSTWNTWAIFPMALILLRITSARISDQHIHTRAGFYRAALNAWGSSREKGVLILHFREALTYSA